MGELGSGQNPGPVAMSTVSEPYGTRRGDVAIATAYEAYNAVRFGYVSCLFAACREGGQVGVVIYGGWQAGWGERGGSVGKRTVGRLGPRRATMGHDGESPVGNEQWTHGMA